MKAALFILYLLFCSHLFAQSPAIMESETKETPQAILDFKLGDSEVDFFITGSWELSLLGCFGFIVHPENGIQGLDGFNDFVPGIIFEQLPDITLSLWIMNMFFLDFTYRGDFEDNLFLMGYEGDGSIPLSHLYIGNREIILPPYPYITVPEAGQSSIGIEAQFLTENTQHDLLLRYDNNEEESKVYNGNREITELRISPADYIQGRFFLLPDRDVQNLEVLIQDATGSYTDANGIKYRKADFDDAFVSSSLGEIEFYKPVFSRVLVYYEKNGLAVGTNDSGLGVDYLPAESATITEAIDVNLPALRFYFGMGSYLGENMSQRQISINGKDYLLIYEANMFSPFQVCSYYPAGSGDSQSTAGSWVTRNSSQALSGSDWPLLQYQKDKERLKAYYTSDLRSDVANRFPLINSASIIYGQGTGKTDYPFDYELLVKNSYLVEHYSIDEDFIPSSVRITRNGREETNFTVDEESGIISFTFPPLPGEKIEIFYRKKSSGLNQGDIIVGWGNRFKLDDSQEIKVAAGLRWNLLPGAYTDKGFSRRGALLASTSYNLKQSGHDLNISLGASFTNPDTTGVFRLAGMEKQNLLFEMGDFEFYPGSVPTEPVVENLNSSNRGILIYKNYRSYDVFGSSSLNPISWDSPEVFDYKDKCGPYLTAGEPGSETTGQSLVMDFSIAPGQKWVSAQVPLPKGSEIWDLSFAQSLYFTYRGLDIAPLSGASFQLYLQIGEISEDLDNDGKLDSETEAEGFVFNDTANNAAPLLGTDPKNQPDYKFQSEDIDQNGFLDNENSAFLLHIDDPALILSEGDSSWKLYQYHLSYSDKKLLAKSRAIRFVILDTTANGGSGKLEINSVRLAGSPVKGEIENGDNSKVKVREIPESFSLDKSASQSLPTRFPEVITLFHNQDEDQRILETQWSGLGAGENVKLSYYSLNLNRNIDYSEVIFFYRLPQFTATNSEKIEFRFLDVKGKGLRFSFTPLVQTEWQKISLDLRKLTATQNDIPLDASLLKDSDSGEWITMEVVISGSSAGILYLDEFYQQEPGAQLGAAGDINYQWLYQPEQQDQSFLKLREIRVNQEGGFSTTGFSTLYGQPADYLSYYNNSSVAIKLLLSSVVTRLMLQGQETEFTIKGGHTITVPEQADPVSLSNSFSYSPSPFAYDQSTEIKVSLKDFPQLFSIKSQNNYNQEQLNQNWNSQLQFLKGNWSQTNQLSLSRSIAKAQSEKNYGETWLNSLGAAWPYPVQEESQRNQELQLFYTLNPDPFGVFATTRLSSMALEFSPQGYTQKSALNYSLGLPLELNLSQLMTLSIIPSYSRDLSIQLDKSEHGHFWADSENYFSDVFSQSYGYNQIPYWELFSDQLALLFLEKSQAAPASFYQPGAGIKISRSNGSSLWDLFTPSQLDFSINRNFSRQGDFISLKRNYNVALGQQAINLFGRFGSHSLFNFYTLDNFTSQFKVALAEDEVADTWEQNYQFLGKAYFEKKDSGSLTIEGDLKWELGKNPGNSISQSNAFLWQLHPENPIKIPFLDIKDPVEYWIENNETLKIDFQNRENTANLHFFNFEMRHETSIKFADIGYGKAILAFAMDLERYEKENSISRLGFMGGIEMNLKF
ncbi:MAG: hypothetical protein JXR70_10080 [Spirochaetales bacterium]|nr:hypothetical protein [Spirochaetales bacterium]